MAPNLLINLMKAGVVVPASCFQVWLGTSLLQTEAGGTLLLRGVGAAPSRERR